MTYDEQLAAQLERAAILRRCGITSLRLVRVEYCEGEPRVSIIGHAILPVALEIWSANGAAVTTIEEEKQQ